MSIEYNCESNVKPAEIPKDVVKLANLAAVVAEQAGTIEKLEERITSLVSDVNRNWTEANHWKLEAKALQERITAGKAENQKLRETNEQHIQLQAANQTVIEKLRQDVSSLNQNISDAYCGNCNSRNNLQWPVAAPESEFIDTSSSVKMGKRKEPRHFNEQPARRTDGGGIDE